MPVKPKKIGTTKTMKALTLWQSITSAALKNMPLDLSTRQMAVLLTVHLTPGPHSLKTLTKNLPISKPAICRAVDVLENAKLLRRAADKKDKRNTQVMATAKGNAYLHEFANIVVPILKIAT